MTITLRSAGTPLTNDQIDGNVIDLNTRAIAAALAIGAIPAVQAGALSASTTAPPNATAVINAIANAIADIVNAAPGALNTLNELAAALGNDANFATTITNLLSAKQAQLVGSGVGQNIKSINGIALPGTGDVTITGGGPIINDLTTGGSTVALSAQQGVVLKGLVDGKVQTGAIAASASVAPNATAVINAIAAAVANLIASSPATLDTLNELATALGNDANFSTTITALIGTKVATLSIVNDLTTGGAAVPLSAAQGAALKTMIDANTTAIAANTAAVQGVAVAFATAIPLNQIGAGSRMPETAITSNTTLSLGATTPGGSCELTVIGNGSATLSVPGTWSLAPGSSAPNMAANKRNVIIVMYISGSVVYAVLPLNDLAAVPNAPTALTLGTATSSTQPLSWTAPAIDTTHGAATLYQPQYRTGAAAFANFGSPIAGLSVTVTGLPSSSSHDYRIIASNPTGTGGTSSTATGSTAAGGITLVQTSGLARLQAHEIVSASRIFTAASNFTAGNSVIIAFAYYDSGSGDVTGITVSGTAATKVSSLGSVGNYASIWIAQNVAGGNANVVVTTPGTDWYISGSFEEWASIPASAFDVQATAATVNSGSLTVTTAAKAQNNELVYAAFVDSNVYAGGITFAGPTSGYTQTALETTGGAGKFGVAAGYKIVNAAGTESASCTISPGASRDVGAIATFKTT